MMRRSRRSQAQLKLSATRLAQMTQLFERESGRGFDVEQRQSEVDQLKAQLEGAQWNLDKTTVRAPADGYVTNLALRKGARVANLPLSPVMAFIDTSNTLIGVGTRADRCAVRRAGPGGRGHFQISARPGVHRQGGDRAAGDRDRAGADLRSRRPIEGDRGGAVCRAIRLDDTALADSLPAGSTGTAAIFTDRVKAAHIIRKVLLRQIAITNYINPF